jgi:hypothetical protein
MGRELRRVPLDFEWPLNKRWKGYLNPHYVKCPICPDGSGNTEDYLMLEHFLRRLLLAGEESVKRPSGYVPKKGPPSLGARAFGIDPSTERRWPFDTDPVTVLSKIAGRDISEQDAWIIRRVARIVPKPGIWSPYLSRYAWSEVDGKRVRKVVLDPNGGMYYPHPYLVEDEGIADVGPTLHEFVRVLPGVRTGGLAGFDNCWDVIRAVLAKHGFETEEYGLKDWGQCPFCKGHGIHPDHLEAHEAWKREDPPTGEGYQLWETVSEGSPITPVFATPEELAEYLTGHPRGVVKDMTYERWLKFINGPGWAVSAASTPDGRLVSGVEAATEEST